jgi:hypothetical protein
VSQRTWYAVIGGGILVIIGLFALRFPVYLDDFDQWGWQVKCGTGFGGDLAQAAAATNASDFVERCGTALLVRRLWTIPLVVIGLIAFFGTLLTTALTSMREDLAADASGN